jgi:hypothetical protein
MPKQAVNRKYIIPGNTTPVTNTAKLAVPAKQVVNKVTTIIIPAKQAVN